MKSKSNPDRHTFRVTQAGKDGYSVGSGNNAAHAKKWARFTKELSDKNGGKSKRDS